ncbi:FxsA family protein [Oceaniglobus roseus]|uniref:FxsA family protein n=1 Tax=Oceaniglobus roseus TaxID=1737570 RepID=UPI000C7EC154|nr:FxsA family protein [Kandeliimicrobium roseum]
MWLFLLFVAVPLIEIALFIQVGGLIGLWPTLLVVVVTALIGTTMVRAQGAETMNRLRTSFRSGRDPSQPLADGAMILAAGVLLLTPGFFTDALGFALLIPAVRRAAFDFLKSRVKVQSFAAGPGFGDPRSGPAEPQRGGDVIDGEFYEVDPSKKPTHGASGWTRH